MKPLHLRDGDRQRLETMVRGKNTSTSMGLRARAVLLAAAGEPNIRIVELTGYAEPTVRRWRSRYAELGIEGLAHAPRPGKPVVIDELALIADTLANDGVPPTELGRVSQ